jgi:hypothetical protein
MPHAANLPRRAEGLQQAFLFTTAPQPKSIPLHLGPRTSVHLFEVCRSRGVFVSTYDSHRISSYAGLPHELYLLVLSILGITQWRALTLNTLLQPEDLLHDRPASCLYAQRLFREDYVQALEEPRICPHCRHFYRSLCPEAEVFALEDVLNAAREATSQRALLPVTTV